MNREDALDCFAGLGDETTDLDISVGQAMPSGVFKQGQLGRKDLLLEFALSGDHEGLKKAMEELYAGLAQYLAKVEQSNATITVCATFRFPT